MDHSSKNPVSRSLPIDFSSSTATEVLPIEVAVVSDRTSSRRHSLRFANDKTERLGLKSCRSRSPVLFRWNAAHEGARLA